MADRFATNPQEESKKMSANFELIFTPPNSRHAALLAIQSWVKSIGYRIIERQTQTKADERINYDSNCMIFVGPQRRGNWIPVAA